MSASKRLPLSAFAFLFLIGMFALFSVMSGPRFDSIHVLDIMRLLTAGFAFGAAIMGTIVTLSWSKFRKMSSDEVTHAGKEE